MKYGGKKSQESLDQKDGKLVSYPFINPGRLPEERIIYLLFEKYFLLSSRTCWWPLALAATECRVLKEKVSDAGSLTARSPSEAWKGLQHLQRQGPRCSLVVPTEPLLRMMFLNAYNNAYCFKGILLY